MNSRRSASVGALPREKKHFVSRNESASGISLDVRCACQFFESDSLLPERINPVESRPSSKLGFHSEFENLNDTLQLAAAYDEAHNFGHIGDTAADDYHQRQPSGVSLSPIPMDRMSNRSFGGHAAHVEYDRLSMRSVGAQPSLEQAIVPAVDLAFVEKYPELEETARVRGLVVGSIGSQPTGDGTFLAGMRGRQLSVGALSGRMRDPDTISVRSGVSIRRVSRSPSKTDLFVADLNIPTSSPAYESQRQRDQRSASASRRNSNMDLLHSAPIQLQPQPVDIYRPRATDAEIRRDHSRAVTPQRSPSPQAQDYRSAKPPMSADYMRPSENTDDLGYHHPCGELMPQHRPIDVSKYDAARFEEGGAPVPVYNASPAALAPPAKPALLDPLQETVAMLEDLAATRNIEDISDHIRLETRRPSSNVGDINPPPLNLDEETQINIVRDLPMVDIDLLVQHENEKALEAVHERKSRSPSRHRSPRGKRQLSPAAANEKMDTLQLPAKTSFKFDGSHAAQTLSPLKRQRSPEPQTSPIRSKKSTTIDGVEQFQIQRQQSPPNLQQSSPQRQQSSPQRQQSSPQRQQSSPQRQQSSPQRQQSSPQRQQSSPQRQQSPPQAQPLQFQSIEAKSKTLPMQPEKALENKSSSYSARFMSIFGNNNNNNNHNNNNNKHERNGNEIASSKDSTKRQKSLSPPKRGRTPSPAKPSKLLSLISRAQPTTIEHVTGSNAVIKKDPKSEPLSVRVTETFSLKVDEMDQYTARPAKAPPVLPPMDTPTRSREDFHNFDRQSADIAEAFMPVVLSSGGSGSHFRSSYSSEKELRFRSSEQMLNRASQDQFSLASRGQLFSAPIHIEGDSSSSRISVPLERNQIRFPSQTRAEVTHAQLGRKSSFMDGRTQSQDRARLTGSHEHLFEARITKTVSFNFDERKSRLTEFENSPQAQQQKEKRDFLERTYFKREHEYEPIGVPPSEMVLPAVLRDAVTSEPVPESSLSADIAVLRDELKEAEELQKDLEERYFSSEATTPRTESRTDYEIHTSQVDSSALEELPLKPENRKKSFMASAQDRTRRMQAGFKNQAGKLKTKLRASTASSAKKAPAGGSPKAKERRRFKAPELSKLKMPELKRPDMSKLKELKRPEFTKFHKPDMSKFKLPEKFSTLKLQRSKSLKENEPPREDTELSGTTPETTAATAEPQKKLFEFNFGTYPRAFRKKKKPAEPVELSFGTETPTEGPSIIPSTDTQPSFESSSSPQGDRGPGPVRSRWADKFSDVSYNDSEGSRYRRYGSEQESFDRESSLERRMKEDLEDTGSEAQEMGILSGTGDNKQFAEFDEENRAIHEISNLRAGEFKRRPMVHQDSDLRSEDSRDAVGWTDKEIQKIKLLRKAELEAEASYLKFPSEEGMTHETQSTASSGKKVVMEEIDDDEFFLRKRGVSEDNIELRQYISNAIREGYDIPVNALEHVGQARQPIEYGEYDVPPPKPRRLHKHYRPHDESQEFGSQRSDYGDDLSMSQNGSDFFAAPRRPMRKGRSRSKYSMESQDAPAGIMAHDEDEDEPVRHERYFDDDEEYLRPPKHTANGYTDEPSSMGMNNLNLDYSEKHSHADANLEEPQPQAPARRRKRHLRETSLDKDAFMNSFSGRSVSNNYLQPNEDVIVYRTEHEYYKPPLVTAENFTDDDSMPPHKSRFGRDDEDEHEVESVDQDLDKAHEPLDADLRYRLKYDEETELNAEPENASLTDSNIPDKFVIDMLENDGYAVVRKEQIPKPTPPARRKKFSRSPGERFATMPHITSTPDSPPPPERPPPPRGYIPYAEHQQQPRPQSAQSLEPYPKDVDDVDDDYEEPEFLDNERPESPRDLQSGEIINKMKYRPLPPPPRPPREKRQRGDSKRAAAPDQDSETEAFGVSPTGGISSSSAEHKRLGALSSDESYVQTDEFEDDIHFQEVEVSTQTDPLPDDFVCEEFEITDDMRVIEPRLRQSPKTLDDMLKEEHQRSSLEPAPLTEDEQLARGLQRFRDANQRSMSERSRASSQADRSKSLSRPQTPSAIIIERRVSTPVPSQHENETMLEASLIVRPIDDLDLEEEALRREGLLTDSSQHSRSDVTEHNVKDPYAEPETRKVLSDYSHTPSSVELETAVENLRSLEDLERDEEVAGEEEFDDSVLRGRTMRDFGYSEEEVLSSEHEDEAPASDVAATEDEELAAEEEEEAVLAPSSHWVEDESATADVDKRLDQTIEDIIERHIRQSYAEGEDVVDHHMAIDSTVIETVGEHSDSDMLPPQPPPRRKSTVGMEPAPIQAVADEQIVTPVQAPEAKAAELPHHVGDLEVERLRVRALQAGQIMVSQLHGGQISAEEFDCKSGNLVVKGVELPPGFIEDIVDRVRSTERSAPLLSTETQTSRELLAIEQAGGVDMPPPPPPKPPRQRDIDASESVRLKNQDEGTQTDAAAQPPPPPVFATTEYLEALVPLLRKDLESRQHDDSQAQQSGDDGKATDTAHSRQQQPQPRHHHRRHHHHHYHRCSSSESDFHDDQANEFDADGNYRAPSSLERRQHSRSRSRTRPPSECPSQSVSQAGRQFISACSLSLINIIDQLTGCIRGDANKDDQDVETHNTRARQVPTLVVLFIIITFGVLIFLLTGRNVHTHHWDFFNPPGNEGRQS